LSETSQAVHRPSRWQGGHFHPHETQRILALEGVELASFRRRCAAIAIDMLAVIAIFTACVAPLAFWYDHHHIDAKIEFNPFENWYSTLFPVLYCGLLVWRTNGLTLGKWLTGIRIVSLTRDRISLWQSVERALGYGASLLEAGSGFLQYAVHPNKQTVHDRIAETIVVRVRKHETT
jgi:uncharacterized RDD family membrane protein YckC